jgi:uncharacterized Tic20 family protein
MSTNETKPPADERVTAAFAHSVVIAYGLGAIGAVVIWLLQKEKSKKDAPPPIFFFIWA